MRYIFVIPLLLCSALLSLAPCADGQVAIINDKVGLSSEADPYGGVLPTGLMTFRLGDDGTLLFHRNDVSVNRLYSGTYAGVTRRLADGARATGNRPVYDFLPTAGNEKGQIAVMGYDAGRRNIYLLTGAVLKTVAAQGVEADGDGLLDFLYEPALDTNGHFAFKADTTQSGMGIFYVDSAATPPLVKKVAVVDATAPEGGTFTFFDHRVSVATQSDGKVVVFFNATTTDGAGNDSAGFYVALVGGGGPAALSRVAEGLHTDFSANRVGQVVYHDFTTLSVADLNGSTVIARTDEPAPGGNTFSAFADAALNDAGTVVFQGRTYLAADPALYTTTASGLGKVALTGEVVGNEMLLSFGKPQINENGLIVFAAETMRGGNPASSIFLSDGASLVRVVGTDDAVLGTLINPATFDRSLVLYPRSLNIHGQIAFAAKLANGKEGVFVASPTSHLRAGGPGVWDDVNTWDFRIIPGPDTPVVADSATDAVLEGPIGAVASKVRSMKVGGGAGKTTLHLQTGSTLTVPKGLSLADKGALAGSATIAGNLTMITGSSLELALAGSTRAAYDFLKVTGTATLGGTLSVTKSGTFEPTRGQIFDLLDLTKRVGTFGIVALPPLNPDGQIWDTAKLYSYGSITVSGATLFSPSAGIFTGTFEGNPTAATTSGSLQLTLAPNGKLSGTIYYAGRRYTVTTILNVDGSGTMSFGVPKKTLQVQVAMVNQAPQLTAKVSTVAGQESQATAARNNPAFLTTSPYVGHYTVVLPPDLGHPEATFPQGTGYAKVTVTTRGLVTLVGVLGDGTPFSTGGQLTAGGEFPFYLPLYALKGLVAGKLVLHGATPSDPVEGTMRWLKPATTTGKFKSAIDATVTIFGSGYRNPIAPAKVLTFPSDTATFHATGGNVDPLADKTVLLGTAYAFKSTTSEPFAFTLSAATFGLGSGSFRDSANKVRTMKGVALQKQNAVIGLLIGAEQNGTFDID